MDWTVLGTALTSSSKTTNCDARELYHTGRTVFGTCCQLGRYDMGDQGGGQQGELVPDQSEGLQHGTAREMRAKQMNFCMIGINCVPNLIYLCSCSRSG